MHIFFIQVCPRNPKITDFVLLHKILPTLLQMFKNNMLILLQLDLAQACSHQCKLQKIIVISLPKYSPYKCHITSTVQYSISHNITL